jgi:3-deoxy-D-manno-octulosonic-acid transferase
MRTLYRILFALLFCVVGPFYLVQMWRRGGWREGFGQRFGRFTSKTKQALTNREMLWLHAASVGEVNLLTQVIAALEPRVPNLKLVVSTNTSTGMSQLRRRLPSRIEKVYYPLDWPRAVQRAVNIIHPEAVVLIEAEIWPNFLWRLRDRRIPVFLVNARFSNRSYRFYRALGFLFRPLFASFAGVGAQNEADAQRLHRLGFRPEVIHVVGSLKFDAARLEERRAVSVPDLLAQVGVGPDRRILLGGSTHAGEELLLADVYLRLRARFPDLFLVVVPRHFERGKEVARQLKGRGLRHVYRNALTAGVNHAPGSVDCLIVNTTGELKMFYEHATVVFVGKSLTAHGGQNPIEPGALGKPILFGPNMENFAAIASAFVEAGGARCVRDAGELEQAVATLLTDPALCAEMGCQARHVVHQSRGAIERTVDAIVRGLERAGRLPPGSDVGSA